MSPAEGCACLAIAYARWVEREASATPILLADMLAASQHTASETFRVLRELRRAREDLNKGAGLQ